MEHAVAQTHQDWLIRVAEIFAPFEEDLFRDLGVRRLVKSLPNGMRWVQLENPALLHESAALKFLRWKLPLEHAWPCQPQRMQGFVEKAASTLREKFAQRSPQAVVVGALDPSPAGRYYRTLASNLRGRALQMFEHVLQGAHATEQQDPERMSLFVHIGSEGLFAGMATPRAAGGYFPGGTKFIQQAGDAVVSRAGAKCVEALHLVTCFRPVPNAGSHWLELGASPGGMTRELLDRGYQVTAIDRAEMHASLIGHPALVIRRMAVADFPKPAANFYQALLCDMNGDSLAAIRQVVRLSAGLQQGSLVIFTLKTHGQSSYAEINALHDEVIRQSHPLRHLSTVHLNYNRMEMTIFFEAG